MVVQVDFHDTNDAMCVIGEAMSGFRHVHVGIRIHDHYLVVPRNGKVAWYRHEDIKRALTKHDTISFMLDNAKVDPSLVVLSTDGLVVSGFMRLWVTELIHEGAQQGLWSWRPSRTSCAGVVSNVVRMVGCPVTATSARHLYIQLMDLSKNKDSGVILVKQRTAGDR